MQQEPEVPASDRADARNGIATVLAGVRVADFTWFGVGPIATRLLADFGAEVIRIEHRGRLDFTRTFMTLRNGTVTESHGAEDAEHGVMFNNVNRNKLSVTLNMNRERGREIAAELFKRSDLVVENFSAGILERWGFTYATLRALRADIIYASLCGPGHSGPYAHHRMFGPTVQALAGLSAMSGLPDREPAGWGFSYMDQVGGYITSSAILMALYSRRLTGQGQYLDCSTLEMGASLIGPAWLDWTANGRPYTRQGNRAAHPPAAPHGVYRCTGDDRWCAIAVFNDDDWQRFRAALGNPDWTDDPRFATQLSRYANQDPLDAHVEAWTRQRSPHEVMAVLQAAAVAAAAVQTEADLHTNDPQIQARSVFVEADHPVLGRREFEGVPFKIGGRNVPLRRGGPLLGEHNTYVYGQLLGMSADGIQSLARDGVI